MGSLRLVGIEFQERPFVHLNRWSRMSTQVSDRVSITTDPTFWDLFIASLAMIRYRGSLVFAYSVFPLAGLFLLLTPFITGDRLGPVEISLALLAFSFTPLITAFAVWSGRRRNTLARGPFTYAFDKDGMHTSGAAFNQTIHWSAIPRVRRSARFLFIFVSPARAYCIPLRFVSDPKVLEQLCTLAGERTDFR